MSQPSLQKKCISATHICNALCVAEIICNALCVADFAMQKTGLQIFCNASQRCVAVICNALIVADEEVRPTLWWNSATHTALRNFLQREILRCRIYLHLTCTNSAALQNFLQRTCTNSVALQNFLQRTCTNSRPVAEIICNAICVAKNICNGLAQTVIALQTDLKFFLKKTAAVSSNSQYN